MKTCSNCGVEQPLENFNKRARSPDGLQFHCRSCKQAYRKAHYAKNHAHELRRIKERQRELVAWFRNRKASLSCERCGFAHPAALHFHHRDPATKDFDLSNAPRSGYGKQRILTEMAKCAILCANCHAIEHWNGDPYEI